MSEVSKLRCAWGRALLDLDENPEAQRQEIAQILLDAMDIVEQDNDVEWNVIRAYCAFIGEAVPAGHGFFKRNK